MLQSSFKSICNGKKKAKSKHYQPHPYGLGVLTDLKKGSDDNHFLLKIYKLPIGIRRLLYLSPEILSGKGRTEQRAGFLCTCMADRIQEDRIL